MSPRTPDVSVVIVTYNNENEIEPCLRCLLSNKKFHTFQIHIIDNASSDNTVEIAKNFKTKNSNDRYQMVIAANEINVGFTAGLNQGLTKCEGSYVLVLNPDAFLREGSLVKLFSVISENSEVGAAAPQLLNPEGTIQQSCRRFPRYRDLVFQMSGLSYLFPNSPRFNHWKMGDFSHDERREVDQPQGACLLFSNKILKKVGLWDEGFPMFFSDVDWCARVSQQGYKIIFEPTSKVDHKKGVSIYRNRVKMIISSHKSFIRYLKKYRPHFILVNHIFAIILWGVAFIRVLLYMAKTLFSKRNLEAGNAE